MTDLLVITLPGDPIGQARARSNPNGGRPFTPGNTRAWRVAAAWAFKDEWKPRPPLNEPLALRVRAVAARPQRLMAKKAPAGRVWRPKKPDADNVLKAVQDSLKDAGVIRDDALIVHPDVRSLYAAKDEAPCVEVSLSLAGEP
jgi:Holliday junction resolvase RusA-like endonuclease